MPNHKTYIVEHLDTELGPWSELEYTAIARETGRAGGQFVLSSIPVELKANLPEKLVAEPAFRADTRGVEELYPEGSEVRKRVCLLDPKADKDINPDDKGLFDVFLFGGILGELVNFLLALFCQGVVIRFLSLLVKEEGMFWLVGFR
jgi:ribosome biogenesis SPOUT family RNA methylase Rps3